MPMLAGWWWEIRVAHDMDQHNLLDSLLAADHEWRVCSRRERNACRGTSSKKARPVPRKDLPAEAQKTIPPRRGLALPPQWNPTPLFLNPPMGPPTRDVNLNRGATDGSGRLASPSK